MKMVLPACLSDRKRTIPLAIPEATSSCPPPSSRGRPPRSWIGARPAPPAARSPSSGPPGSRRGLSARARSGGRRRRGRGRGGRDGRRRGDRRDRGGAGGRHDPGWREHPGRFVPGLQRRGGSIAATGFGGLIQPGVSLLSEGAGLDRGAPVSRERARAQEGGEGDDAESHGEVTDTAFPEEQMAKTMQGRDLLSRSPRQAGWRGAGKGWTQGSSMEVGMGSSG